MYSFYYLFHYCSFYSFILYYNSVLLYVLLLFLFVYAISYSCCILFNIVVVFYLKDYSLAGTTRSVYHCVVVTNTFISPTLFIYF